MLSSDSRAPRGLPGRFTIRVFFRTPATTRDNAARGVLFTPAARINSPSPGTSVSITDRVASGVTSRGPRPVPPEVNTASQSPVSVHVISRFRIRSNSSGRISSAFTCHPWDSRRSRMAGPDLSSRFPWLDRSLKTRIFARKRISIWFHKVTTAMLEVATGAPPIAQPVPRFASSSMRSPSIMSPVVDIVVVRWSEVLLKSTSHSPSAHVRTL